MSGQALHPIHHGTRRYVCDATGRPLPLADASLYLDLMLGAIYSYDGRHQIAVLMPEAGRVTRHGDPFQPCGKTGLGYTEITGAQDGSERHRTQLAHTAYVSDAILLNVEAEPCHQPAWPYAYRHAPQRHMPV